MTPEPTPPAGVPNPPVPDAAVDPSSAEYLTPREVAALFNVTTSTVERWADAGKIGSTTTLGGHRRYPRADIDALLHPSHEDPDVGPQIRQAGNHPNIPPP